MNFIICLVVVFLCSCGILVAFKLYLKSKPLDSINFNSSKSQPINGEMPNVNSWSEGYEIITPRDGEIKGPLLYELELNRQAEQIDGKEDINTLI